MYYFSKAKKSNQKLLSLWLRRGSSKFQILDFQKPASLQKKSQKFPTPYLKISNPLFSSHMTKIFDPIANI
jgi:hypothetical protein